MLPNAPEARNFRTYYSETKIENIMIVEIPIWIRNPHVYSQHTDLV